MEVLGLISISLVLLMYSSMTNLKNKVNTLDRKFKKVHNGGNSNMSKLLSELVGKQCVFMVSGELSGINGTVLDVDDEFVKIKKQTKKSTETILLRTSDVSRVTQIDKVTDR